MLTTYQPKMFQLKHYLRAFLSPIKNTTQSFFMLLMLIGHLQRKKQLLRRENSMLKDALARQGETLSDATEAVKRLQEQTCVFRESNDVKVVINRWITAHCEYLNQSYSTKGQPPSMQAHLKQSKQAAIRNFLANNAEYFDACDVCYIKDETGFVAH